jgi:alpha-beta hydrolase superfamily lysophospholipase
MYKFLKKPFFGRFMVRWHNPLPSEQQTDWRPITTKSKSGAEIKGLFATPLVGEARATIVLGHPMGKEAKGYFLKNGYTDMLRNNGYNTLIFDLNGFGESEHGNFSYFEDIVAISIVAAELTPEVPIGYHGISLGGKFATIAFADPTHRFDFAIIESATTTLDEFWVHFPIAHKTLKVLNFFLPAYKKRVSMIDRIKEAQRLQSLLLIYSETDDWTPVEMGRRFQKNSPIAAELWTVKNAKHAAIMKSEHKAEYQAKILDFFHRATQHHAAEYHRTSIHE